MMKKIIFLGYILAGAFIHAQVGVYTDNPSATLDIVSKGTDGTTKALEINNSAIPTPKEMVTVLNNNNVGIGITNPFYNLEVGDYVNNGAYFSLSQTGSNTGGQTSLTYFTKRTNTNSLTNSTSKGWKWFALSDSYTNPALANSLFLEGWTNGTRTQNVMVANPNGNVGFGIQNPSAKVHINASAPGTGFRLVDGSQGAGKVLVSDAGGNASWNSNSNTFVGISAYYSGSDVAVTGFSDRFRFDTVDFAVNNSLVNNTWIVGEAGYYVITARIWITPNATTTDNIYLFVNNGGSKLGTRSDDSPYITVVLHLNVGDTVEFRPQFGSTQHQGSPNVYFSGYKIGN